MVDRTFVLVAVKGTIHRPIVEGVVKFVQSQRTLLKQNWKGWKLQVRTIEGYKAKPILDK